MRRSPPSAPLAIRTTSAAEPKRRDVSSPGPFVGTLALGPGLALYLGPGGTADPHAHHAVQLVVSAGGPLEVSVGSTAHREPAVLVPAGVRHSLGATGSLAVLLVERHGRQGRFLDELARRGLSAHDRAALAAVPFPDHGAPAPTLSTTVAAWLAALGLARDSGAAPSPVVSRVLVYLQAALGGGESVSLVEAAARVGISPSRLTHRLREELGISFRALVPWMRIKVAVLGARRGRTLTEAAIAAGFADAAHLSRTFRAMFGLPPSLLLGHVEVVEIDG